MSHDLATINGKKAIACATDKRGLPWHGLGQMVSGAMTWQQAMEMAQLNWTVSKHQLSLDGVPVPAWGIIRDTDRQYLGTVGAQYTPVQNEYAFSFVDALLEADGAAHYESAGALRNGERVWTLARVNGTIGIRNTADILDTYLLFTTSHDGSLSTTARLTTVRVVCNNTLTMALSRSASSSIVRIKHTPSAEQRLAEAQTTIANVHNDINKLQDKLNLLASRKLNAKSYTSIMSNLFPDFEASPRASGIVTKITELFESNDHNAIPQIRGTAYNLLNACTEYADHYRATRLTPDRTAAGMSEQHARAESALWGTADTWKSQALDSIMAQTADLPCQPIAASRIDNILSNVI